MLLAQDDFGSRLIVSQLIVANHITEVLPDRYFWGDIYMVTSATGYCG